MSHWKVILAAVVIFTAGVFAGGVGVRFIRKPKPAPRSLVEQPLLPFIVTEEFVRRMKEEVGLEPEQRDRIAKMLWASQARVRELYSLVGPEVSQELNYVREAIRAELNPDQQKRFEELVRKQRQRRWGDGPRPEGQRPRSGEGPRSESNSSRGPLRGPTREPGTGGGQRPGDARPPDRRPRSERTQTNAVTTPQAPAAAR